MKRAKQHAKLRANEDAKKRAARHPSLPPMQPPKRRNPVARSPLLGKGGAHGKSTGAKRRAAKVALAKMDRDEDPAP